MTDKRPKSPVGLGSSGSDLWSSILGDLDPGWGLDARELHSLERACRCEDEMSALEEAVDQEGVMVKGSRGQRVVNGALSEARQLRLVQLRLLAALELDDPQAAHRAPGYGRDQLSKKRKSHHG